MTQYLVKTPIKAGDGKKIAPGKVVDLPSDDDHVRELLACKAIEAVSHSQPPQPSSTGGATSSDPGKGGPGPAGGGPSKDETPPPAPTKGGKGK